jgi:hypothetical protein
LGGIARPGERSLVAVLLFGGMAAFSILGFFLLDLKARRRMGCERWRTEAPGHRLSRSRHCCRGRAPRSRCVPDAARLVAIFV